jgi:diaminopimelate decarboxylase
MADIATLHGTHRASTGTRWGGTMPLDIVPRRGSMQAANLLSWVLPSMPLDHESALTEFVARTASCYDAPFLLFDLAHIEDRLRSLEAIQRRQHCRFLAPVKSFPHHRFLELSCRHLAGFDVSNLAEYRSLPPDLSGKTVALTSPVLPVEHLSRFLERGNELIVFLDSPYQLEQLELFRSPLRYGIRLDSSALVRHGQNGTRAQLAHSRFGVPSVDAAGLLPLVSSSKHRFAGFHVHHGSEQNGADTYIAMAEAIEALRRSLGITLGCVDLGGGQHNMDLATLEQTIAGVRQRLADETELYLEPGRLLTQGSGYAVGRVENWRRTEDSVEYVTDLSMGCHLRWSSPTLIVPRPPEPERPLLASFHGPTCHEDDSIGRYCLWTTRGGRLPFTPGDLVLFGSVSGYSASIRTSFNGIEPVAVRFM